MQRWIFRPVYLVVVAALCACSGATYQNGASPLGAEFRSSGNAASSFQVLHTFEGGRDGAEPTADLVFVGGIAYGTTYAGGDNNDAGTVFSIDSNDPYSVLYRFVRHAPPGQHANPAGGLVPDDAGNFYGTTTEGGTMHQGTVYKVSARGKVTTLHTFTGPDGLFPYATLLRDARGNLYGTTEFGGTGCGSTGCGTVFKVDTRNRESVLYSFAGGSDGVDPFGGVVRDSHGNLFGTTSGGGSSNCAGEGCGIVYKIDSQGHETILHRFTNGADGGHPFDTLLQGSDGALYGTAESGGTVDGGLLFKMDKAGNETVLYNFLGGSDGFGPFGNVIRDAGGNFFGTTEFGGTSCTNTTYGCGTVFEYNANGTETILYRFTGKRDGAQPVTDLVMDRRGYLYGTTEYAGDKECRSQVGCGVAFRLKR